MNAVNASRGRSNFPPRPKPPQRRPGRLGSDNEPRIRTGFVLPPKRVVFPRHWPFLSRQCGQRTVAVWQHHGTNRNDSFRCAFLHDAFLLFFGFVRRRFFCCAWWKTVSLFDVRENRRNVAEFSFGNFKSCIRLLWQFWSQNLFLKTKPLNFFYI